MTKRLIICRRSEAKVKARAKDWTKTAILYGLRSRQERHPVPSAHLNGSRDLEEGQMHDGGPSREEIAPAC